MLSVINSNKNHSHAVNSKGVNDGQVTIEACRVNYVSNIESSVGLETHLFQNDFTERKIRGLEVNLTPGNLIRAKNKKRNSNGQNSLSKIEEIEVVDEYMFRKQLKEWGGEQYIKNKNSNKSKRKRGHQKHHHTNHLKPRNNEFSNKNLDLSAIQRIQSCPIKPLFTSGDAKQALLQLFIMGLEAETALVQHYFSTYRSLIPGKLSQKPKGENYFPEIFERRIQYLEFKKQQNKEIQKKLKIVII